MKKTWRIEVPDLERPETNSVEEGGAARGGSAHPATGAPPAGAGPGAVKPAGSAVDDAGLRSKWNYLREYYTSLLEHDP
jgi:hypothetical protein